LFLLAALGLVLAVAIFTQGGHSGNRCQVAPQELVSSIAEGLTAQGGATLRNGQVVKSSMTFTIPGRTPDPVYMVAADIQAAGMEGTDDVAVWP
jgi:hypothetical protein